MFDGNINSVSQYSRERQARSNSKPKQVQPGNENMPRVCGRKLDEANTKNGNK